jgi:hypothetical protein
MRIENQKKNSLFSFFEDRVTMMIPLAICLPLRPLELAPTVLVTMVGGVMDALCN